MKLALGILILIFSTSIWAQTKSDSFLKLFEVSRIKSTNEIEYIYTQEKSRFSMIQYIQYMKQEVKDYMEYIKDHPEETELFNQQEINLLNLKKYNIQSKLGETSKGEQFLKLLDDPDVQALAKDFDEQVQKIPLKPNLLAAPSNSKYFYKLRIIEELFDWVFNRIEDSARTLPHYSAIRYLFYMAINNMIDRQRYYQTLMQHYLDDPELVASSGLTDTEIAHIRSSFQESRLKGVRDFFKSKRIQKQWDTFGAKKFDRKKQKASKRLEDPNRELSQIHRLNYAFIEATENNQSYYFNLLDKVSLLNRKLSIAYDKNNPKAIRFQRVHLTIAQMTLQYLPLPGYVKDKMSNYLSSKYHQQMTTEAALMGYLLSQQKYAEAQMLSRQSLNPYIIMDMEKIGQNKY